MHSGHESPWIREIIDEPTTATLPKSIREVFFIADEISTRKVHSETEMARIVAYSDRMDWEWAAVLLRDIVKAQPEFNYNQYFLDWLIKHSTSA